MKSRLPQFVDNRLTDGFQTIKDDKLSHRPGLRSFVLPLYVSFLHRYARSSFINKEQDDRLTEWIMTNVESENLFRGNFYFHRLIAITWLILDVLKPKILFIISIVQPPLHLYKLYLRVLWITRLSCLRCFQMYMDLFNKITRLEMERKALNHLNFSPPASLTPNSSLQARRTFLLNINITYWLIWAPSPVTSIPQELPIATRFLSVIQL
jgi:hypothetical protein